MVKVKVTTWLRIRGRAGRLRHPIAYLRSILIIAAMTAAKAIWPANAT
jgi:hypothetical protein